MEDELTEHGNTPREFMEVAVEEATETGAEPETTETGAEPETTETAVEKATETAVEEATETACEEATETAVEEATETAIEEATEIGANPETTEFLTKLAEKKIQRPSVSTVRTLFDESNPGTPLFEEQIQAPQFDELFDEATPGAPEEVDLFGIPITKSQRPRASEEAPSAVLVAEPKIPVPADEVNRLFASSDDDTPAIENQSTEATNDPNAFHIAQPSPGEVNESQQIPCAANDRVQKRLRVFKETLGEAVLDLTQIQQLSHTGIPDGDGLRSTYWKLLLDYLPMDRSQWETDLCKKRALYQTYREELIDAPAKAREESQNDNPLSDQDAAWGTFFKDEEIWEEINKDVMRTYPDMSFFCQDHSHYDALRRTLFVYAKLNPGIRYVQGMNEVLAPLYYVFANDPDPSFRDAAEADSFFCFVYVMSNFRDNFCEALDKSDSGLEGSLKEMMSLLKQFDPTLWKHLKANHVKPQFYGIRWLSLLLSQEFEMPDLLRLWDSFFSSKEPEAYLLHFGVSMLLSVKADLLAGDFGDNIKLLQQFPCEDMNTLLASADQLMMATNAATATARSPAKKEATPSVSQSLKQRARNLLSSFWG